MFSHWNVHNYVPIQANRSFFSWSCLPNNFCWILVRSLGELESCSVVDAPHERDYPYLHTSVAGGELLNHHGYPTTTPLKFVFKHSKDRINSLWLKKVWVAPGGRYSQDLISYRARMTINFDIKILYLVLTLYEDGLIEKLRGLKEIIFSEHPPPRSDRLSQICSQYPTPTQSMRLW